MKEPRRKRVLIPFLHLKEKADHKFFLTSLWIPLHTGISHISSGTHNSFPGTKLNDGGWKLHLLLRCLECHFLIVHTLSSSEEEPHPSWRLTHDHAPGTFLTWLISALGQHIITTCSFASLRSRLPTAKCLSKNKKSFAFVSSITCAELFLEFWQV